MVGRAKQERTKCRHHKFHIIFIGLYYSMGMEYGRGRMDHAMPIGCTAYVVERTPPPPPPPPQQQQKTKMPINVKWLWSFRIE